MFRIEAQLLSRCATGSSRYVDFCHVARLSDRCENAKKAFEAYISSTSPVDGKRTRSAVILQNFITFQGQLHYQVAFRPPSCTTG